MMKLLLTLFFVLSCASRPQNPNITFTVEELPEARFIFRNIQAFMTPEKQLKLVTHEHVQELFDEAKGLGIGYDPRLFIRMDLKRTYVLDVGLMLSEPGEKSVPVKTKIRPAGRYLVITYTGPGKHVDQLFHDFPATIKRAKVTPEDVTVYFYKQSALNTATDTVQLFLRVK